MKPYFLECMVLLRFHSFSVPSSEAVSSTTWLGWKVKARMASKWLRSVKRGFHVFLNSSLLSCIWHAFQNSEHMQTGVFNNVRQQCVITSIERSLSLATVRSASSPRFISPPPTASIMKTSEENPRAPPAGWRWNNTRLTIYLQFTKTYLTIHHFFPIVSTCDGRDDGNAAINPTHPCQSLFIPFLYSHTVQRTRNIYSLLIPTQVWNLKWRQHTNL